MPFLTLGVIFLLVFGFLTFFNQLESGEEKMIDKDAVRDSLLTDEQLERGEQVVQRLRGRGSQASMALAVQLAGELKTTRAVQAAVALLLSITADVSESDKSVEFFRIMEESRKNVLEMTLRGSELIAR